MFCFKVFCDLCSVGIICCLSWFMCGGYWDFYYDFIGIIGNKIGSNWMGKVIVVYKGWIGNDFGIFD